MLLNQPFKIRRLGHFGFNLVNMDESVRFYTDLLGFRITDITDFAKRATSPEQIAGMGNPNAYFTRYGSDHHSLVLFNKRVREVLGTRRRYKPGITVNMKIAAGFMLGLLLLWPGSLSAQDKRLVPLTVGYPATSGLFAPLWAAVDQGIFAKNGLDVKVTYIRGNRVMMSALTAGEIQLYQGAPEGLIRLVAGGGDGIFVASQYNFVANYVLITDPSITRVEELKGKRILLDPTSPTYGYMLKILERAGIRKEEVTFVQFGTAGQAERTMAVLTKQASATILSPPNTYAVEKQGLRMLLPLRELNIRQLIVVTATTTKFLREKRQIVEAFLRGYLEGLAFVRSHPDLSMNVIGKYTRQQDKEVLRKVYEELLLDLPRIPYVEEESVRATVQMVQSLDRSNMNLDPKNPYDNSLLRGLEK